MAFPRNLSSLTPKKTEREVGLVERKDISVVLNVIYNYRTSRNFSSMAALLFSSSPPPQKSISAVENNVIAVYSEVQWVSCTLCYIAVSTFFNYTVEMLPLGQNIFK